MKIKHGPLCPIDPRVDLAGFLAWQRAAYGDLRMEGDGGSTGSSGGDGGTGDGTGNAGGDGSGSGSSDKGFPENTPVAEMTDAQAAAYWKDKARKHENTAKARADYDQLKARAARADELEAANATEQEKAVKAARDEAAAQERARVAPQLVLAKFEAVAAGRIDAERLRDLTDDLDLSKYLTDKGEVDSEKVTKKVAAWAPKETDTKKTRRYPDTGGGNRGDAVSSKGAAGAAEAARRFATSKQ
jgi:hypothetical protein